MSIWAKHQVGIEETIGLQIGPLTIWTHRTDAEWKICWQRGAEIDFEHTVYEDPPKKIDDLPANLLWHRWAAEPNEHYIQVKPVLPDRPVVARPVQPLQLPPGRSAKVYISLPIWLNLQVGAGKKSAILCEIPTTELSNTWFGEPFAGELCYSLSTGARRKIDSSPLNPHRSICTVTIQNTSESEELNFERVCIHAPHLSLFAVGDRLWTNDVRAIFKGFSKESDVHYSSKAPEVEGVANMISEPRITTTSSLLKRTFYNFKSWTYG